MLGPIKKVSVVAAVEGLILHPLGQRAQRPIQIQYATHKISSLGYISSPSSLTSAEAYGVIGIRDTQFRNANASLIASPKEFSPSPMSRISSQSYAVNK